MIVYSIDMRFVQPASFYRHLASASSHRLYVIACSDDFERKSALDASLKKEKADASFVIRFSCEEASVLKIMDAINSPMLFGGEPFVVVDEVDKKLADALASWLKEPLEFGYLFLGCKSKCPVSLAKEHATVLDLCEEKPWERTKRLQQELFGKASKEGFHLDSQAAEMLLERLDGNSFLLHEELEKLFLYTADRQRITSEDVEKISVSCENHTFWEIAEALVWEQSHVRNSFSNTDTSIFFALISSMRSQLRIGLKMHALLSAKSPISEWGAYFPKLKSKVLEKKAHLASKLGVSYFQKGLERLFELESLAKSSSISIDLLFDIFRVKLVQ